MWKWSSVWAIVLLPLLPHLALVPFIVLRTGINFYLVAHLLEFAQKLLTKWSFSCSSSSTHMLKLTNTFCGQCHKFAVLPLSSGSSVFGLLSLSPFPGLSARTYPQVWPHLSSRQSARKFASEVSSLFLFDVSPQKLSTLIIALPVPGFQLTPKGVASVLRFLY